MANPGEKQFTISIVGEITGEKWYGSFRAKMGLSLRDVLRRDARRRELLSSGLGAAVPGEAASAEATSTAIVLSELAVRLTDAPQWWDGTDGGADLQDANLVAEVYRQAMAVEREALEARRKQAEADRAAIRAEVVEGEPRAASPKSPPSSAALEP